MVTEGGHRTLPIQIEEKSPSLNALFVLAKTCGLPPPEELKIVEERMDVHSSALAEPKHVRFPARFAMPLAPRSRPGGVEEVMMSWS